jgi:hypothetical protein
VQQIDARRRLEEFGTQVDQAALPHEAWEYLPGWALARATNSRRLLHPATGSDTAQEVLEAWRQVHNAPTSSKDTADRDVARQVKAWLRKTPMVRRMAVERHPSAPDRRPLQAARPVQQARTGWRRQAWKGTMAAISVATGRPQQLAFAARPGWRVDGKCWLRQHLGQDSRTATAAIRLSRWRCVIPCGRCVAAAHQRAAHAEVHCHRREPGRRPCSCPALNCARATLKKGWTVPPALPAPCGQPSSTPT